MGVSRVKCVTTCEGVTSEGNSLHWLNLLYPVKSHSDISPVSWSLATFSLTSVLLLANFLCDVHSQFITFIYVLTKNLGCTEGLTEILPPPIKIRFKSLMCSFLGFYRKSKFKTLKDPLHTLQAQKLSLLAVKSSVDVMSKIFLHWSAY